MTTLAHFVILNHMLCVDHGWHFCAKGLILPLTFNKICTFIKWQHQLLGLVIKTILVSELKNRKYSSLLFKFHCMKGNNTRVKMYFCICNCVMCMNIGTVCIPCQKHQCPINAKIQNVYAILLSALKWCTAKNQAIRYHDNQFSSDNWKP